MHHALRIQEILLNIFSQTQGTYLHERQMAILAITCLTFKEPALDLLWENLNDLSPLARCLPDAYRQATPTKMSKRDVIRLEKSYALTRSPTQAEWDTLQSYTCRIRTLWVLLGPRLGRKSIRIILGRHTAEPLFPNLRRLAFACSTKTALLLHLPLPSITSLHICFSNVYSHLLRNLLASGVLAKFSLSSVEITRGYRLASRESLDFAHLSLLPLTELILTLGTEVSTSDIIFPFPRLVWLRLHAKSLTTISLLLANTRMPALRVLQVIIPDSPSRMDISSFLANVQISGIGPALHFLSVEKHPNKTRGSWSLCMQDLQPCIAFNNLRHIEWDIDCKADLIDDDLITLTSAWPHLETLLICTAQGWKPSSGITPHALARILKLCPLLKRISLALDTRNFVRFSTSDTSLDLPSPREFTINTLTSPINHKSVTAIATFFARLTPPPFRNPLRLKFPRTRYELEEPMDKVYEDWWDEVWNVTNVLMGRMD